MTGPSLSYGPLPEWFRIRRTAGYFTDKTSNRLLGHAKTILNPDFGVECGLTNLLVLSDAFIHAGSEARNAPRKAYTLRLAFLAVTERSPVCRPWLYRCEFRWAAFPSAVPPGSDWLAATIFSFFVRKRYLFLTLMTWGSVLRKEHRVGNR